MPFLAVFSDWCRSLAASISSPYPVKTCLSAPTRALQSEKDAMRYEPIVQEIRDKVRQESWTSMFNEAIESALTYNIPQMKSITSFEKYLDYIDWLLHWVPREDLTGKDIYYKLCMFSFLFNQPSLQQLQSPVSPTASGQPLLWLSAWLVRYAQEMGRFLDSPESITRESLESFKRSPDYRMEEYIEPRGSWRTFNEFFARNFKPGFRPVASVADPSVIVSPADCTFEGSWRILSDSTVTLKGLSWKISELLDGSRYQDRFNDGVFMHAFLKPSDYHRIHTPVDGTVLEARIIPGQVYLEVTAMESEDGNEVGINSPPKLQLRRNFNAPNTAGYQFCQTRGLIILDSPIGLVAVLPVGMCQVSSVILTAEKGRALRKGEEVAYFQFGGSDVVLLFEAKSDAWISAAVGTHYKMGAQIGGANPHERMLPT